MHQAADSVRFFRMRSRPKSVELRGDSARNSIVSDDGHKRINGSHDPDLRFDGIGGRSRKRSYSKMPPDPLEEQLDMPSRAMQFRNGS